MRQQDVHDELRARLHEAVGTREPDRVRILARVERGMAAPPSRPVGHRATRPLLLGWVRVVSATAAVAGVLAVGGYAVASAVKNAPPEQKPTVAVSPTPSTSPDATPSRPPVRTATPEPGMGTTRPSGAPSAGKSPNARASAQPPATHGERSGPLWLDGSMDPHSNDFWAQSDVTLQTTSRLTALTVQLKVAQTGGVASTGAWRALPEADFTQTVQERNGFLVYTWTLKDGRTVPAGRWVFAGQYNHQKGGRNAKDDNCTVTATADGHTYTVSGDFAAHTSTGGDS